MGSRKKGCDALVLLSQNLQYGLAEDISRTGGHVTAKEVSPDELYSQSAIYIAAAHALKPNYSVSILCLIIICNYFYYPITLHLTLVFLLFMKYPRMIATPSTLLRQTT